MKLCPSWILLLLVAFLAFACSSGGGDDDDKDDDTGDDDEDNDDEQHPGAFNQCVDWYILCAEKTSTTAEANCRWIKLYDLDDPCFAAAIDGYLICLQQLDCDTVTYANMAACYEAVQADLAECYY